MTRTRALVVGGLVVALFTTMFVVLTNLNSPASGQLRHDDSLRTTSVEKEWTVEKGRHDTCFRIRFEGDLSGNARSTWGFTGPRTVWENLRVHETDVHVEAYGMTADGQCDTTSEPPPSMHSLGMSQQWKSGDDDWHGGRRNWSKFGAGPQATSHAEGIAVRLRGGSYGRGDPYEAMVSVYVEPTWRKGGVSITDGLEARDTVELAITDRPADSTH